MFQLTLLKSAGKKSLYQEKIDSNLEFKNKHCKENVSLDTTRLTDINIMGTMMIMYSILQTVL